MSSIVTNLSRSTAQEIVNWVTTADGCVHTTGTTQLDFAVGKFVQTRRDCFQLVANSVYTVDVTQLDSWVVSASAVCIGLKKQTVSVCMLGVVTSFHECDFYNQQNCNTGIGRCQGREVCPTAEPGKRTHCYVFWNITSGVSDVILKGCWLDTPECYNRTTCVATHEQTPSTYFCCCESRLCNVNFSVSSNVVMLSALSTRLPQGNLL